MTWEIDRQPIPTTKNDTQDEVLEQREKMIANLQAELAQAGKVCNGLNSDNTKLREELDQVHADKNKLITKQYHIDYQIENQKKVIENLNKTLAIYERENKAMRELLKQWI